MKKPSTGKKQQAATIPKKRVRKKPILPAVEPTPPVKEEKPIMQSDLRQSIGKFTEWLKARLQAFRLSLPGLFSFAQKITHQFYDLIRKSARWKKLLALALVGLLALTLWTKHLYTLYLGPNVTRSYLLFIHEKDNIDKIASLLDENGCLKKVDAFRKLAHFKDYDKNIKAGAYQLQTGWSLNKLINLLRSGAQTPVMVTFNNIRTREDLAGKLARQLQSDSLSFLSAFKNDSNATRNGFKPETFPSLFIPNTYSLYWTTTPTGFLSRMKREYDLYWNETRKLKAKTLGLTADQVATLASIVQEESNKDDEKPVIAGVYLNRLHKKWPLQADPTIRFALGDFTIKRILTAQLSVESPYNTYKNTGLPPGPINFPEVSSLEAVLNAGVHEYYYFCAKEDFSGYHNFAKTLSEHNRNAQKYQAALNRLKIFK
jgi:UPF0755 protein